MEISVLLKHAASELDILCSGSVDEGISLQAYLQQDAHVGPIGHIGRTHLPQEETNMRVSKCSSTPAVAHEIKWRS